MDIGAKEIDDWHKERGWDGIGYHYIIRRNGKIEAGRSELLTGAHAKGYNRLSIGICLVGGDSEADFTMAQYLSLYSLKGRLSKKYNNPEVLGHRDLPGVDKDCPCFDVKAFFDKGDV
jgi:N-acetyl-anhydromuramyl-L-alanine amidase AmpD